MRFFYIIYLSSTVFGADALPTAFFEELREIGLLKQVSSSSTLGTPTDHAPRSLSFWDHSELEPKSPTSLQNCSWLQRYLKKEEGEEEPRTTPSSPRRAPTYSSQDILQEEEFSEKDVEKDSQQEESKAATLYFKTLGILLDEEQERLACLKEETHKRTVILLAHTLQKLYLH